MTIHFHTNFSPTFIFYFLYWNNSCSIYVDIGQAEIFNKKKISISHIIAVYRSFFVSESTIQ